MNTYVRHGSYIVDSQESFEKARKLKGPLTLDRRCKISWKSWRFSLLERSFYLYHFGPSQPRWTVRLMWLILNMYFFLWSYVLANRLEKRWRAVLCCTDCMFTLMYQDFCQREFIFSSMNFTHVSMNINLFAGTGCSLHMAGKLLVAAFQLLPASCCLPAADCQLLPASCRRPAASSQPPPTHCCFSYCV
jgi:hypothetical protein